MSALTAERAEEVAEMVHAALGNLGLMEKLTPGYCRHPLLPMIKAQLIVACTLLGRDVRDGSGA
jgi:hypothetical protein